MTACKPSVPYPRNIPQPTSHDNYEALPVIRNFINGEFVIGDRTQTLTNTDPSTGEAISYVQRSNENDVNKAVEVAWNTFESKEWVNHGRRGRAAILRTLAERIFEGRDRFAEADCSDVGKPFHMTRTNDVLSAVKLFRRYAAMVETEAPLTSPSHENSINYVQRKPIGVVGIITPWNAPFFLLCWKVAAALSTGNCVVCKPSELAPTSANLLCEYAREVGIPPGVLNVVHGYGEEAGKVLVTHPRVPCLSFTGDCRTGRDVMTSAVSVDPCKKVQLQLSGNNAMIICEDADIPHAVSLAISAGFAYQGQLCTSMSRILVHQSLYSQFLEKFTQAAKNLHIGDPWDRNTLIGPLVSEAHRERIEAYVHRIRETKDAMIECGGEKPTDLPSAVSSGVYYRPTVVTGISTDHPAWNEEILGPVVIVSSFNTEDEAISLTNSTPYGLCATVLTSSLRQGHALGRNLNVGTVWVNSWLEIDGTVPFGGEKASGMGREGGQQSLEFYTIQQTLCVQYETNTESN